jgi:glycosyltransferase involved in cell wall biosynthesis
MSWSFQQIYRSADAVIVHSQANRQKLLETFHIPENIPERKVILIKHGNYRFFAERHPVDPLAARREYFGEKVNGRIFLVFGAMRHYKGIDLALKAMSHLPRLEDMHLIVAGKPFSNVLEECKKLAGDLRLLDHVTFMPGYFDDQEVAKLHSASDICVFPYREIFKRRSAHRPRIWKTDHSIIRRIIPGDSEAKKRLACGTRFVRKPCTGPAKGT